MNNLLAFPIPDEKLFKVLIVGYPTAGKTSFVQRYVQNTYKKDYKGTVGVDFALKVVKTSENQVIKLQLRRELKPCILGKKHDRVEKKWRKIVLSNVHLLSNERFTWMTRVYYKDSHGCVIMFDLGNKNSLMNTIKWKKDIDSKCTSADGSPLPCILLANKCELAEKQVTNDEVENFHKEHNFLAWSETSAKEGIMVNESMKFLMEVVIRKEANSEEPLTDSIKLSEPAPRMKRCC